MRNIYLLFLCLLLLVPSIFAQGIPESYFYADENVVTGGLGMTWIDGQPYTTFTFAPEIAVGKIGVGLYLQLLMDNNNEFKLRKDEYQGGAGILRAINYIRYGRKYDPVYTRIGSLEMASLANGFLMWNYNNASNYDKRKIGLALDIDFGKFGFESVTNNLGFLEVIGANLYFRPVRFANSNVPILRNFRIYGTYVYDNDVFSLTKPGQKKVLRAYGLGADLLFIDTPIFKSGVYYDYGKFKDFGSGQGVGINALFPEFVGLFALSAKFEKRFINDEFIPDFFGPLYELQRSLEPEKYFGESSIFALKNAKKNEGYFGQLAGHIIHKVSLVGSYQRLNDVKGSGIVHLEALAPDLVPKFELRAFYDKIGIETFKDFRTLDNRSVLTAEVGYRLNMFLVLSTVYRWYWVRNVKEDGTVEYKPVERIEPRISVSFKF
ncbi:MAG: hypothetical protein P8Y60_01675 [Calditrichota bacterium]|jgi:hypothetical protein